MLLDTGYAEEHETKLLEVGNTGVGKSSLGCRILGVLPFESNKAKHPFKVARTAAACPMELCEASGDWLGDPSKGRVRVVDTPGELFLLLAITTSRCRYNFQIGCGVNLCSFPKCLHLPCLAM